MAPHLDCDEWLSVVRAEYLTTFIRSGGSSVKFAVAIDEGNGRTLGDRLLSRLSEEGFLIVKIDAGAVKVHMIDQVFFAVAEQVPWRNTVEHLLRSVAVEAGYPEPPDGPGPLLARLSVAADLDERAILMELRKLVTTRVFKNRQLMKDFRVAMTQLALVGLTGGPEADTTTEIICDWLTGRNRAVSAVKPYSIFSRISRTNARYMLESLCVWLRMSGYAGLVLLMDIDRLAIPRNPRDELLFYSKAMLLDAYEVLRQFIDRLDRLEGCFLVVTSGHRFLDDEGSDRGLQRYQALRFRVYDEVRDRDRANPMASLVRITTETNGGAK
jgi:P-loop Domain of unknown function (DUF2791)